MAARRTFRWRPLHRARGLRLECALRMPRRAFQSCSRTAQSEYSGSQNWPHKRGTPNGLDAGQLKSEQTDGWRPVQSAHGGACSGKVKLVGPAAVEIFAFQRLYYHLVANSVSQSRGSVEWGKFDHRGSLVVTNEGQATCSKATGRLVCFR